MRIPNRKENRILQVEVTTTCDLDCFDCTRALAQSPKLHMPLDLFEQAVASSADWIIRERGVLALFGGNPVLWKNLEGGCEILAKYLPPKNRGLWTNRIFDKGPLLSKYFTRESYINAVVHGQSKAADEFAQQMPWVRVHGRDRGSKHASIFVASQDFLTEDQLWEKQKSCSYDITWSSIVMMEAPDFKSIGGYSCEIAGTHARVNGKALGVPIQKGWLDGQLEEFKAQYAWACPRCSGMMNLDGGLDLDPSNADHFSRTNANVVQLTISKKRNVEMVESVPSHDHKLPIHYLK